MFSLLHEMLVKFYNSITFILIFSKLFPHGAVMEDYNCEHTDDERSFICSCTSLELEAALEDGYVVTKVLRVLEYQQSDDQLFRPYISELMREKMHASGFDDDIRGNTEAENEFIKECKSKFDISIDRAKMVPNKGKRALSKLMLNNLCKLRILRIAKLFFFRGPILIAKLWLIPNLDHR